MLVSACAKAGIAAMTGDGVNADVMKCATEAIKISRHWNSDCKTLEIWKRLRKMRLVEDSGHLLLQWT